MNVAPHSFPLAILRRGRELLKSRVDLSKVFVKNEWEKRGTLKVGDLENGETILEALGEISRGMSGDQIGSYLLALIYLEKYGETSQEFASFVI